jgi:hypothetical protein
MKTIKTLLIIIVTLTLLYLGLLSLSSLVIKPISQLLKTVEYVEVPADLLEFQTYKYTPEGLTHVSIKYSYEFLGKNYQASKVNVDGNLVLKDKYSFNVYKGIYDQYENGRLIAFVDPKNPDSSLLNRSIDGGASAAGWMGFSVSWIIAFYLALWVKRRVQTKKSTLGSKPGIASFESNAPGILGLVAQVFLLAGIVLVPCLTLSVISDLGIKVFIVISVSFIFPVMGWFIYRYSHREQARFDEIGDTRLHLKPEEGMNQGDIAGYFDMKSKPLGEFIFTLRCAHSKKIRTSSRQGDSKITELLHVEQVGFNETGSGSGNRMMFLFHGFKKSPASGAINNDESIIWTLACEGRVRAFKTGRELEFKRSWRIPVVEGTKESLIRHWFTGQPELNVSNSSNI